MNANKLQVLVIDDDAVVGRSFDRVLSDKGYDVSTAMSGEEAMDTIQDHNFDVVFTDIKMPGMDGLEATRIIRDTMDITQPIIIALTANATTEDRAKCLESGMDDYASKPVSPSTLERLLDKHNPIPGEGRIPSQAAS